MVAAAAAAARLAGFSGCEAARSQVGVLGFCSTRYEVKSFLLLAGYIVHRVHKWLDRPSRPRP